MIKRMVTLKFRTLTAIAAMGKIFCAGLIKGFPTPIEGQLLGSKYA